MIKAIIRFINQWSCNHPEVRMKSGAKNRSGWNHYHKVTCLLCGKEFSKLGKDLYDTYVKETECYCNFGK